MRAKLQERWIPIHKQFEESFCSYPDKAAIIDLDGTSVTYNTLNEQANQLAHYLRNIGVKPETIVCICLNRSSQLIVSMLACIKSDAAFFFIDSNNSSERISFLIEDSKAQIVITKTDFLFKFKNTCKTLVLLDHEQNKITTNSIQNLKSNVLPKNSSYLIYTSGTTGKPKATINTQSGLANVISFILKKIPLTCNDRFLQFCSLSFDGVVCEVWLSLLSGATLVLSNIEDYLETLRIQDITAVLMSPSALAQISPDDAPTVRIILSGGEACSLNVIKKWRHVSNFYNAYGPAEAAIISTLELCDYKTEPSIGFPINSISIYILDEYLNKTKLGEIGEIYISGDGVARGYLNQSALTAEKFLPDPYTIHFGERMYATGDYGEYLANGKIKFRGRKDNQIKINGIRIELEEVETYLNKLDMIKSAAVLYKSKNGIKFLVAYVVLNKKSEKKKLSKIRSHLIELLPLYMIPQDFILIDKMPLNSNGKLDRKALINIKHYSNASITKVTDINCKNEIENFLNTAWSDILRGKDYHLSSNFFNLGGDSLSVIRLIALIKNQYKVNFTLSDIFKNPTLKELSDLIQKKINEPEHKFLSVRNQAKKYPSSFVQERLYFLNRLEPKSIAYNVPTIIEFSKKLDTKKLIYALESIIERHGIFRTSFEYEDGQLMQKISSYFKPKIKVTNLNKSYIKEKSVINYLCKLRKPFDLSKNVLYRFNIINVYFSYTILSFDIHHALFDGWSLGVFLSELKFYFENYEEKESVLPPVVYQYTDYTHWLRKTLTDESLNKNLEFWSKTLEGAPLLTEIPLDFHRTKQTAIKGERLDFILSEDMISQLKIRSMEYSSTPFIILLTVFNILISRLNGISDIVIGTTNSNRELTEVKDMIGCLVSLVILRNHINHNSSFQDNLSSIQQNLLESYSHQEIPFEKIVEKINPERSGSFHPIFQIMINMVNIPININKIGNANVKVDTVQDLDSKFDLTLYFFYSDKGQCEGDKGLKGSVVFRPDLFTKIRIQEIVNQFLSLLDQCLKEPTQLIHKHLIQTSIANKILPNPKQQLKQKIQLHSIFYEFEKNAHTYPDRTAIEENNTVYTYKQLQTESNSLAFLLKERGIKKGEVIAIYADRKATLVTAILGILKADAVFLILDSNYPVTRLLSYLKKSQPQGFITLHKQSTIPSKIEKFATNLKVNILYEQIGVFSSAEEFSFSNNTNESDPAYIFFTSGTSGEPKGVIGSHKPIINFINWYQSNFNVTHEDRFSLLSGLGHDPIIRDIFVPLSFGATICIPDSNNVYDSIKLKKWISLSKITISHITPLMWNLIIEGNKKLSLNSLRYVFFGGAPLSINEINDVFQQSPKARIINCYGATETPQIMGYNIITQPIIDNTPVLIGSGIQGVQLLVINKQNNIAIIGEIGEIWIRTPYLTQGYLHNEQETASKFIINPFNKDSKDLIYKTGDLGRYTIDGKILLLGRKDRQVKIRGYRVELEEIENTLILHPDIIDAVVTTNANNNKNDGLNTYVVIKSKCELHIDSYIDFLRRKLPSYMIPTSWFQIKNVPLSPNGKIDFQSLEKLKVVCHQSHSESLVIQNEQQKLILDIWKSVLKREVKSLNDNFFNLGGHSLLIAQVLSKIYEFTGCQIPLKYFFDNPTITSLSHYVIDNAPNTEDDILKGISANEKHKLIQVLEGEHVK